MYLFFRVANVVCLSCYKISKGPFPALSLYSDLGSVAARGVGWNFLIPMMSLLFPHTSYAEDQSLSSLILTTHVLNRGFQSGILLGSLYGAGRFTFSCGATKASAFFGIPLLRSAGVGGAVGVGLMVVGLPIRMWAREEIEWKDRAWRLLENKGQLECDTYGTIGTVAGLLGGASSNSIRKSGWISVAGGAGVGSLIGVVGYMAWRYGVNRGKWEEAAEKVVEEINPLMPIAEDKKSSVSSASSDPRKSIR